jgi:hypothetical protein
VAQQFQWNFHYAGKDGKFGRTDPKFIDDGSLNFIGLDATDTTGADDAVTSALAIPVNRPVELRLRSKDVIHNFWVPQLRFKQDLVREVRTGVRRVVRAASFQDEELHARATGRRDPAVAGDAAGAVPGKDGRAAGEVSIADLSMISNFQLPIANLLCAQFLKIGNWQSAIGNNLD